MFATLTSFPASPLAAINGLLAQGLTTARNASGANSASGVPMSPLVIMCLCAVAGIGTVLVLPGRREASIRMIGGIVLLAAAAIFSALLVRWTVGDARGGMGAYFWIFAAISIIGAVRVVTHSKPVYSALYFVLTVFASAGLFLLVGAEFMAAALVVIYAGAILVTYVFVIMLAAEATPTGMVEHDAVAREPVIACTAGFAMMAILLFVVFDKYQSIPVPKWDFTANVNGGAGMQRSTSYPPSSDLVFQGSTQQLGAFLFKSQLVNLELGGLILTVAMVGAIMIARKRVIVTDEDTLREMKPEVLSTPATPVDDNPHSLPVDGTRNPRQKAYPET